MLIKKVPVVKTIMIVLITFPTENKSKIVLFLDEYFPTSHFQPLRSRKGLNRLFSLYSQKLRFNIGKGEDIFFMCLYFVSPKANNIVIDLIGDEKFGF